MYKELCNFRESRFVQMYKVNFHECMYVLIIAKVSVLNYVCLSFKFKNLKM